MDVAEDYLEKIIRPIMEPLMDALILSQPKDPV